MPSASYKDTVLTTVFAGMSTGIGSAIAFTAKRTNYRFLSVATGFSAGVMLYVSFVEIFFKGVDALTARYGDYWGHWVNAASFFGGMLLDPEIFLKNPEDQFLFLLGPDSKGITGQQLSVTDLV